MSEVFVIAQGGGPTAVINATLAGAASEARRRHPKAKILGARYGVRGVAAGDFVDLGGLGEADLQRLAATPSSALGSTRDKPDAAYCGRILDGLKKAGATAFIYIGGNDTAGTLDVLEKAGDNTISLIHAPKTIDNDLVENDHTPGYISAALFVTQAFYTLDLDFRAMPGIYVGIVMGRHAGFLTAAAAAWQRDAGDGPHLVYIPERPFSVEEFVADIRAARARFGRCVVAMSEGVTSEGGAPLAESLIPAERRERDAHGNLQISGGDLGLAVQATLAREFPKVRARVDTFGYLPRGFIGSVSELDRREAYDVGKYAVEASEHGSGSVALKFEGGATRLALVGLDAVAGKTRLLPDDFLDPEGRITDACRSYLARLLPPRPDTHPSFV